MLAEVPSAIVSDISAQLNCVVKNFSSSQGGCINHGGKITTNQGEYFLKWNDAQKFPSMFAAERDGLMHLSKCSSIKVPNVILTNTANAFQYLVLEFIDSKPKNELFWTKLGEQL